MKNYEKIRAIIGSNNIAQVRLTNGEYILYSSIVKETDYTVWIRHSRPQHTTTEAYKTLWQEVSNESYINQLSIATVKAYTKQPRRPKEGDWVVVTDSYTHIPYYHYQPEHMKNMRSKKFKVHDCNALMCEVYNEQQTNYYPFPVDCIAPRIDNEPEIEELTLTQVCKLLGKNIKIIK